MSDDFLRVLGVGACAWLRWLPSNGMTLLHWALSDRVTSIEDLFDQSCIDPEGSPLTEPNDDEINAARERRAVELIGRAVGHQVETNRDLFAALSGLGIIKPGADADTRLMWCASDVIPRPQERLDLSNQERAEEERIEIRDLDERLSQPIIELFVDGELTSLTTTLDNLAGLLECDPEAARQAVIGMLGVGDFSTTADVPHISAADEFALTVDWDVFHEKRISVSLTMPDGTDDGDAE